MGYLLPRDSYNIKVEEAQLGVTVSRDLPLRVLGLRFAPKDGGREGPRIAERTGRVHLGDLITSVNNQDIRGIPANDIAVMISCRRPAEVGFSVAQDSVARV